MKLSIDPSGQFVREYVIAGPPVDDQDGGPVFPLNDPAKTGHGPRIEGSHSPSHQSVTCHQFKRLITPAVDGRLQGAERASFERHAHDCTPCRQEYEVEAAVKQAVHRHVPRVKAPQALRDTIARQIRMEETGGQRGGRALVTRLRAFVSQPVVLPLLLVVLAAFMAVAALLLLPGRTASEAEKNLLVYSLQTHHALEAGELAPEMVSADADRLQGYLSTQASLPVTVPVLADFTLVGGLAGTYNGLQMAHLVYRGQEGAMLSIAEAPLEDVLRGKSLALPLHVRNALLHTGWYTDTRESGTAVVLWTHGTTLCAAVARMSSTTLRSALSRLEGHMPADSTW